jgi:hypothetical protein
VPSFFIKDSFGNRVNFDSESTYSPDVADDMLRRTLDLYRGILNAQVECGLQESCLERADDTEGE